jgi:hypothetical protein
MPLTREIKIVKVPLSDKEKLPDYPQTFPKMPRMYLELFENKAKIKQDLINKEYIPKEPTPQEAPPTEQPSENTKESKISHKKEHEDDMEIKEKISTGSKSSKSSRESESSDDSRESDRTTESDRSRDSYDSRDSNDSVEPKDENRNKSVESRENFSDKESNYEENSSEDLSIRLKELLGETDDSRSQPEKSVKQDKYSRNHKQSVESRVSRFTPYEKYKQDRKQTENAPTLAELEAKGHYQGKPELRDINHITVGEYDDEDKKRELIFKFDLLKKSYPSAIVNIPEYTIHSDLREMQKSYDITVRKLSLDSTVENYKQYLLGGFMLVEFVFGNFLGFDMQGFTQQQIVGMHNYERLLIELGEKSYVPSGSKWPVELRLLFVIIMNAGFFIMGKMIMRKTGANLMGMLNTIHTPPVSEIPKPKRRMKGPNINVDNIPDIDEEVKASPPQ